MHKIAEYLKNVRIEMAKVSWPTRNEVLAGTALVLGLSVVVSVFVFVCDRLMSLVLNLAL